MPARSPERASARGRAALGGRVLQQAGREADVVEVVLDRADLLGAAICLIGVTVIMYGR
ncbi:hypothetical protein OM076_28335 [Solirubrobacter ginsenosidimutans]|uniref:Uncharacterized protein n=1 Tax=Solirubrobacter ginsenosidimutans TaxID=490573 RepID=A0A9X3MZS9_9ACTN|nr:hypothetical protein [Solirubrobacter ginsenosidimutans]MDA0164212.1 hypothetical protein [Solirubrobacter ginsenosidimutans]